MKTLNVRLVVILLVCGLVLGGAVFFIHAYQVHRTARFRLDLAEEAEARAEDALEADDLERAIEEYVAAVENYSWYVNLKPKDLDAMQRLGLLRADLLAIGEIRKRYPRMHGRACSGLENLLREDSQRLEARRKLVELYLLGGRYTDAKTHLKSFPEDVQNDAELLELLAACQIAAGEDTEALDSLQGAIENAPQRVTVYPRLAWLLENRLDQPTEADNCMKKLVQSNPDSSAAHLRYGRYLFRLVRVQAIDARKHPILMDAMVPKLLRDAVENALEALDLDEEDPAASLLPKKQNLLAEAVKRVLETLDERLTLDNPDELLLRAMQGLQTGPADPAALSKAKDDVLEAMTSDSQLAPDDRDALSAAAKQGVVLEAVKNALATIDNASHLVVAAKKGVLAEGLEHAIQARQLASEARKALSLGEGSHAPNKASLAGEVVTDALRRVLESGDEPMILGLSENRPGLVDALKQAIQTREMSDVDRQTLLQATERGILVEALKNALKARQVASRGRDTVSEEKWDKLVSRVALHAVKNRQSASENGDCDALLLAIQCNLWKKEFEEARRYAELGIKLYEDDVRMYAALADVEVRIGLRDDTYASSQRDKALASLRRGLKKTRHDELLLWKIASILIDTRKTQEALQTIEQLAALEYRPSSEVPPPATAVGFLRARIRCAQGEWRAAIQGRPGSGDDEPPEPGFERIRSDLVAYPSVMKQTDFLLASCYRQLGNFDQEQAAYRRILTEDPLSATARGGIIESLGRSGRLDEAIEQFRELAKLGNLLPRHRVQLARLLVRQNLRRDPSQRDWKEVENLLSQAASVDAESVDVPILRAEVLAAQDRTEEAQELLEAAQNENPKQAELWNMLVSLAQRNEDWERVEKLLRDAEQEVGDVVALRIARARYLMQRYKKDGTKRLAELAHDTEKLSEADRLRLLTFLSYSAQQQEDWQQAELFLQQAERQLGDNVTLRFARAQYLTSRYQNDAAEKLHALAEQTDQLSEADRLRLWDGLMRLAVRLGDDEHAKTLGRRLLEKKPNDPQIRLTLFEVAIRAKDDAAMERMLKQIERIEGKGPMWMYGQAVRLTLQARSNPQDERLDQAQELLEQARKLRPSWRQLVLLEAGIHDQKHEFGLALEEYLQAIDMGDRNAGAIRRAVQLLARRGRNTEALRLLGLLEGRETRFDEELSGMEKRIRAQEGDYTGALKIAEADAEGSDDYQDYIFLGEARLLVAGQAKARGQITDAEYQQKLAGAEKALRHAISLNDANTATWTALIRFCRHTGKIDKGEAAIREAYRKIPADEAPLAMARWYEVLGRSLQAQKMYEEAFRKAPSDPATVRSAAKFYLRAGNSLAAERLLKLFVGGKLKAQQADLKWARRALATILINRGGYQNLRQARGLLTQNLQSPPRSAADIRLMVDLLPSGRRREAIAMLESLGPSAAPDDQFKLAQLYQQDGSWIKARAQMIRLLGSYGDRPQYVAAYVKWLLQRDMLSDANAWLEKLDRLSPHNYETISRWAELSFRYGQYDQALKRLNDFLTNPKAQPANETQRLLLVAQDLEQFIWRLNQPEHQKTAEQYALRAEDALRTYVKRRPGQEMLLAAFLARQGRIDQALDEVERALGRSDVYLLAKALSLLLKSPAATPPQVQRGMAILQSALQKYNRPIPLLLLLGDVRANQKSYDEAEAAYREILSMERGNAVGLNNLAVLLALREVKLDEALELINRAIELAGPLPSMLDSRASVYMAQGQHDKALDDLKNAIAGAPSPIKYFHLAQAYDLAAKRAEATAALKKAVDLGLNAQMVHPLELPTYQKLLNLLS